MCGGLSTGYVALKNDLCCSVIARPEKKNGDFRAPQNGRAGGREPKKKGFPDDEVNSSNLRHIQMNLAKF